MRWSVYIINLILVKHYEKNWGVVKLEKSFVGIKPTDLVTVTKMKHIVEVQYMEKKNAECRIKKLDKDSYVVLETGEVKEFEHIENRKGSLNSLRQTFKKIRYLINNNFEGKPNELHCTLTYRENMTDTKRLYTDLDKFIKRLKYKYKGKTTIDYLNVVEPQGRGAWHCHLLLRFNDLDAIFIENEVLRDLWGHGFVTVKSLKDIDNIGAYLSAYLSDIELNDTNAIHAVLNEMPIKEVDGKKYIKGGRLHMYPPGMNLYRKSKGIEYPERKDMRYKNVKKIVGSAQPHYEKTYHMENDDFQNTIHYEQYNLKRQ